MGKILDEFGRPYPDQPREPRQARASHYDIARTNPDNARQWEYADAFDSDRANSPAERQTARNRSRHETDNNPNLKGATKTVANYEVGHGPTLHVIPEKPALDQFAEDVIAAWQDWCEATNFAGRLWTMSYSRVQDGEVFARLGRNQRLKHPRKIGQYLPVELDWQPFEADQCHTIFLPYQTPNRIDGIWFDDWGNPTFYDLLRFHPGGVFPFQSWQVDTVPADYVLHLFYQERPKQHRGMPELSSSTDLFADRRRFRKATVGAAESAANIGGFLTTDQPADDGYAPSENSITAMPRNSLIIAPNQYDYKQVDPAHPAQTYEMFASETLNEATRPICMPLNIAKCDSSGYNFASGRLDIMTFWGAVALHQRNTTWRIVNPLFRAWYAEARNIYETNGKKWREIDEGQIPTHGFLWQGQPYCDPEVEQNADEAGISTGTRGLHEIYARRGKDWSRAQIENAKALGMTVPEYLQWIIGNLSKNQGGAPSEQQADGENGGQGAGSGEQGGGQKDAGQEDNPAAPPAQSQEPAAPQIDPEDPDWFESVYGESPDEIEARASNFWKQHYSGLAHRINGHNGHAHTLRATASPISGVPNIRQDTDYRCGAAASMAVGKYYGVGPDTLDAWSDDLGTTAAQSTSPDAIVSYLSSLGLQVNARQNMGIDDLAAETAAGRPVIVCCQDYVAQNSDPRDAQAQWDYGHWMVCLAVQTIGDQRFLVFQDSSEENMERLPGGDVPAAEEDAEIVVEEPGRRFVSEKRWLPAWHDEAVDGVMYDHYGISVGLAETATPSGAMTLTASARTFRAMFEESKHPRGNPKNAGQFGSGGGGAASKGGDSGASKSDSGKKSGGGQAPASGKGGAGGSPAAKEPGGQSQNEEPEADEGEDEGETQVTKRPAVAKGAPQPATREGKGKDAKIVLADGTPAPAHISPAMIPPAWKNVQVFTDPDSEILATGEMTGKNGKTNKKTVYKPSYEAEMQAAKYVRIVEMLKEAPDIQGQIDTARQNPKTRDAADCAWLINEQATRPGSEADTKGVATHYGAEMTAENIVVTPPKSGKGPAKVALKFGDTTLLVKDQGTADEIQRRMQAGESLHDSTFWLKSHGATTLEGRHVVKAGDGVRLQFVGKEGVWHDHLITNPKLAAMLLQRKDSAGDSGKLFGVSDGQLASFCKDLDHGRFSPKDFRTKRANEIAVDEIKRLGDAPPASEEERKDRIKQVATAVSNKLGNRWQQCVESYINPAVWSVWPQGAA